MLLIKVLFPIKVAGVIKREDRDKSLLKRGCVLNRKCNGSIKRDCITSFTWVIYQNSEFLSNCNILKFDTRTPGVYVY